MKCIALIGYMCVGKTTVGRDLARRLGLRFYDLDWYIEERFHKRISAIFAEEGEAHFRDLERRMLHEVAQFEDIVLSCGGGTPAHFDNMDFLNSVAHTVYLRAEADTICAHLSVSKGRRPLLEGKTPKIACLRYSSNWPSAVPIMSALNTSPRCILSTPPKRWVDFPAASSTL